MNWGQAPLFTNWTEGSKEVARQPLAQEEQCEREFALLYLYNSFLNSTYNKINLAI
ncbi:hypothetical protein AAC978_01230 [Desulfitobacterium sp. THU1]|uniref:hypothetical protein n=1 Tax=Desulfitobacterium sp. THU1 TaxID=3138072 RepID=UPI00311E22D1